MTISDFLLTEQAAEIYLPEQGASANEALYLGSQQGSPNNANEQPQESSDDPADIGGPSWEIDVPPRMLSIEYPRNMGGYVQPGDEAYDAYWSAWINELADADELDRIAIHHHLMP